MDSLSAVSTPSSSSSMSYEPSESPACSPPSLARSLALPGPVLRVVDELQADNEQRHFGVELGLQDAPLLPRD